MLNTMDTAQLCIALTIVLCPLLATADIDACNCLDIGVEDRLSCGGPFTSFDQCKVMGCCYDSRFSGKPSCYMNVITESKLVSPKLGENETVTPKGKEMEEFCRKCHGGKGLLGAFDVLNFFGPSKADCSICPKVEATPAPKLEENKEKNMEEFCRKCHSGKGLLGAFDVLNFFGPSKADCSVCPKVVATPAPELEENKEKGMEEFCRKCHGGKGLLGSLDVFNLFGPSKADCSKCPKVVTMPAPKVEENKEKGMEEFCRKCHGGGGLFGSLDVFNLFGPSKADCKKCKKNKRSLEPGETQDSQQ